MIDKKGLPQILIPKSAFFQYLRDMALLLNYEYDIFISYRHNDNLDGWVTDFVQGLEWEIRGTLNDSQYF